jgi:hypothetical protein
MEFWAHFAGELRIKEKIRIILASRKNHMAHKNGKEYQIRIVRKDGTEELSSWMHSIEEVAHAMILARKPQGTNCWLLVRSTVSSGIRDTEQVLEYPIMDIPSPRYIPNSSRYLQVVDSRDRQVLGLMASGKKR